MRSQLAREQALATPKYKETSVGCSLSRSGVSPVPHGGGASIKHTEVDIDTSAEMLLESSRPKGLVKQPDHAQS
jgi:hypothetical protein